MNEKIHRIDAREILDSRGNPTLYVTAVLKDGTQGSASVPSGASTGIHEALELRDGDKRRYRGKGVLKAVKNIEQKISPHIRGMNAFDQQGIDNAIRLLDGTRNKHRLGANAILGASLAILHASAKRASMPLYVYMRHAFALKDDRYLLPTPLMNVLNGGAHADSNLDMQEFIIIPHAFRSFSRKLQAGTEVFHALRDILLRAKKDTDVGNEGGYAPNLGKTEDALAFLKKAVMKAKYKVGGQISFGIDIAASEFFNPKIDKYILKTDRRKMSAGQMIDLIEAWSKKYPLMSIEDPLDQDAWPDWSECTKRLGKKMMIIGDDLYVTNPERIRRGIEDKATNAVLIKMNQIGTISETMEAIRIAKNAGQKIVISHRSGETSDTTIADLAVAVNAEFIKTGAPSRSERLVKYNRLLAIEEELS